MRRTIQRLTDILIRKQSESGTWSYSGYKTGCTSLVLLALQQAGLEPRHDACQRAVAAICAGREEKVYSEALVLCALEPLSEDARVRQRMRKALDFLVEAQAACGGWTYGRARSLTLYDLSNTQFAILGLGAAERAGLAIPKDTRKRAVKLLRNSQQGDGGWAYSPGRPASMSMTCAGVASLCILGVAPEKTTEECGKYKYSKSIRRGLKWIRSRLNQPGGGVSSQVRHNPLYTWYALERVAIFLDMKTFGNFDWYREGVPIMLQQTSRKLWPESSTSDCAFALLFLAKAATPLAIAKWHWRGDWNNDHDDVRTWVALGGQALGRKLDWVPSRLLRPDEPAAKASMIFVNGHKRFVLRREEAAFLRRFLSEGGTVVAEPCCGSREFGASFMQEMSSKLFPGFPGRFTLLEADHDIYGVIHELDARSLPIRQLRGEGCRRKRVFLLARDISCALNGERKPKGLEMPEAGRFAVNLLAFSMGGKRPAGKLDRVRLERSENTVAGLTADQISLRRDTVAAGLAMPFGRLRHRGDWGADPRLFDTLVEWLKQVPACPVFDGEVYVSPLSEGVLAVPILFVTGHDVMRLTAAEMVSLRGYLQNGGFLLADACCASKEFDLDFREFVRRTLPNDRLEPIPADDPLYMTPFRLSMGTAEGTKAYVHRHGRSWAPLMGVRREGRWVLVYSPVDFSCALEGDLDESVMGYKKESALKLLANILGDAMRLERLTRDGDG
ncbi:MAG: DUF4159 domain-containing protein, partial [Lentisphaeria bacterium]|nr:DUF4159 domain-containing protein [Lentisphaeria bacterium]